MIYGQWRRTVPRSELDEYELRAREGDEAWDLRHEALADFLDTWLGQVVRLRAETPIGKITYPKHSRWRVVWRTRDWLIVAWMRDITLLAVVRSEKFEPAPLPPPLRPRTVPVGDLSAAEYLDHVMTTRGPT